MDYNNGLGYFYFLNGSYLEAHEYFYKALLRLLKLKNFIEIILTCYNLALVFMHTHHYDLAVNYLEKFFLVIKTLNIKNVPYHSYFGIYTILAFCHLKNGDFAKCLEYIEKTASQKNQFTNDQELFYFDLLQGLVEKERKNFGRAEANLNKARLVLKKNRDISDFKNLFPLLFLEYGMLKKEIGKEAEAEGLFQEGLDHCNPIGSDFNRNLLLKEMASQSYENRDFNLSISFSFSFADSSSKLLSTIF